MKDWFDWTPAPVSRYGAGFTGVTVVRQPAGLAKLGALFALLQHRAFRGEL